MTSAQTMRAGTGCASRHGTVLTIMLALLLTGCSGSNLQSRTPAVAPYDGTQLWAIAPPLNESGVSLVDTPRVADMIAREVQAVEGIDALPVNRVLLAMDRLGLVELATTGDLDQLLDALDADAIVIGSVSAYDPYPPIVLGMSLQLYTRVGIRQADRIDPVQISRTTTGEVAASSMGGNGPVAQAAGIFSGHDHQTLKWLQDYAASRHVPDSAYGADRYLVSMDLFAQFVSHRLIGQLLRDERWRVRPMVASQEGR